MNQENLKFLQDRLFYLGTEKRLYADLEKNMEQGKPEFNLLFSNHYDKDQLSAVLQFRKSDSTDMYFLNRYDAVIQKPAEESKTQTFYLDHGKGVTMKEAYNLLDGRSVNKELKNKEEVSYNAWLKLDFSSRDEKGNHKMTQFHKNYGYDLPSELFKLPISQMTGEDFKRLVASLEKGNLQQIKLNDSTGAQAYLISANPQFKTINIFDEKGRSLSKNEKNELFLIAEEMKKGFEKGISKASTLGTEAKIEEQKMESPSLAESQKKRLKEQKPEQKKSPKEMKKEQVASLLPKKQAGHRKGPSL